MGVRLERPCANRLELSTSLVVGFQIQHVGRDDSKEQTASIEPDPSEHRSSGYVTEFLELIDNERAKAAADGEGRD